MAQQSHEGFQPELQDDYVENQTLEGARFGAAAGAAAGAVTGVAIGAEAGAALVVGTGAVISAPVIIPALIGAGVMGVVGTGIFYLCAESQKKDALDRKQKKKYEDRLTERKHQKSALRKTKQRLQKEENKQLSKEMRANGIHETLKQQKECMQQSQEQQERKRKKKINEAKPKQITRAIPTVTTTTPTTVSNAQDCKLNSSSCTTKIATYATITARTSDMGRKISKALIVLISIEQYFGKKENSNKCIDLTSARMDTQHIIELYADKYEYNIITNKHKYCKLEELKNLLREAQGEFSKGDYECIFVIFSGHGTKDKLILSDYYDAVGDKDVGVHYKYNKMDRTELECYFNGDNVTNKADKLKVYIMDACRGSDDAAPIINDKDDRKYTGVEQRGNQQNIKNRKGLHANENRIIFYPNTEPYSAYGYKESGGILINGLYQTMIDDANMDKNLDEIGDLIKDKAEADLVPVLGNNGKIIGEFTVKIEIKTTMKSRNMREIYFVKSEDKDKERIKTLNELNKDLNLLYV